MCGRDGDGNGLLSASCGCEYVKAEVILDVETIMTSDIEYGNESIRNT